MIPLSILRERLQLPESMTFEDYVRVDDDVQAHEEITEMDIMAELQSGSVNNEQVEEEEEEEEENVAAENVRVCSHSEARQYVHELRRFFEASAKTTDSDFLMISKLELTLMTNLSQRHMSINDFFR